MTQDAGQGQREGRSGGSDLREVVGLFLRLRFAAFRGPAVHVALMREEVVRRRGWMPDESFLDLLGAPNLIPGPNSTEMALHIGRPRAGWASLLGAGLAFILPAASIVLGLAWAHERYGTMPAVVWMMYGIKPAIIGIILGALWALGKKAVKGRLTAAVGGLMLALYLLSVNEIALLLAAGLVVIVLVNWRSLRRAPSSAMSILPPLGIPLSAVSGGAMGFSLPLLFLTFLKIGSVLYGSGYVLLALMAGVTVQLGRASIVDWPTAAIAVLATVAIQRGRVNPAWVILCAALLGAALFLLHL